MSLVDRFVSRFKTSPLPDAGAPFRAESGGRIVPILLPQPACSDELMNRADAALKRLAQGVAWTNPQRSDGRLDALMLLGLSARENGCEAHGIAAVTGLDEFFAASRVGEGSAWEHSSDVAWRVMRLSLLLAYLPEEIDPGLRRLMAGAVHQHALWLQDALSKTPAQHPRRIVLQAAGLVVAGQRWSDLPGASKWWSQGLSRLRRALPDLLDEEGGPSGALSDLVEGAEAAVCAYMHCRPSGLGFPMEAEGALLRALTFLRAYEGIGSGLSEEGFGSLWGEGELGRIHRSLAMMGTENHAAPVAKSNAWSLSVFRGGGWAFGHGGNKSGSLALRWHLSRDNAREIAQPTWGDTRIPLLVSGAGGVFSSAIDSFEVERARVDGRTMQVRGRFELQGQAWIRVLRAEGNRLVIEDSVEGADGLELSYAWRVAPGWAWDGESVLVKDSQRVHVSLSEDLEWSVDKEATGVVFRATAWVSPSKRIFSRFELR